MKAKEIQQLIGIGLSKPRWYKRNVWNKAEKVMNFICEKFPTEVERVEAINGDREFMAKHFQPIKWALAYKKFIGETILASEAYEYMQVIAKERGLRPNSSEVYNIYNSII